MSQFTRRDFLKVSSFFAAGAVANQLMPRLGNLNERANIIILLFDAMSAKHMSLYGYHRETTPNLSKFAEVSTLYHSHYSAGNFTTCGTASMLTGMFPWKHRAFNQGGLIRSDLVSNNPYTLLGDDYYRVAFSQNPWPDHLVGQFYSDVDEFLPLTSYSMRGDTVVFDKLGRDRSLASITFEEFLFTLHADTMGSSLFGYLYKSLALNSIVANEAKPGYPKGVPEIEGFATYLNEDVFQGVYNELVKLEQGHRPYFSYFHLYSPHSPYKPNRKFMGYFNDHYQPISKPVHPFHAPGLSDEELLAKRTMYDRQVAQVDDEFGRLIDRLSADGVLDDSYLIVTSDHGEMFERGFYSHGGFMMYDPVVRIPLLIHAPRQATRQDIQIPTSNVDLLPTLLSIAGKEIPAVLDGKVLPGFGGQENTERPLFAVDAVQNSAFLPITKAALMMRKGDYKLITYPGYEIMDGKDELYNIQSDPEEINNLAGKEIALYTRMKDELSTALVEANQPFER